MSDTWIVSVSGRRGIVGASLTPDVAARYAAAFEATLPPGPIAIARDGRAHGPVFAAALRDFFLAAGRDVIDCGVAATPTLGIVVREENAAGGVQVSASHNPAEYNGLKLFSAAGRVLPAAAGAAVLERFRNAVPAARHAGAAPGRLRECDGSLAHVRLVAAVVDAEAIRRRRPRVWLDACHGAGGLVARRLFERLGCEFEIDGEQPDGRFEHPPEPTAENLAGMLPRIPRCRADVGFFQDPDADRLAIATADGRFIGEEATLALCVDAVLARTPGPVVVNCSTSGMTAAIAARHGAACHVSAVGEANVVDEMLARRAVIGGEGNGGVIDPRVVLVRDSIVAMALVLERLATDGPAATVAGMHAALPRLVMKKERVGLSPEVQGAALAAGLDRIALAFPDALVGRLDGLRLDFPGGWLLVRASNTEPIVRLVAEAADEVTVDDALRRARAALDRARR